MLPPQAVVAEQSTARGRISVVLGLATVVPLVFAPLLAPNRGTSEIFGVLVVTAYAGHIAVTGWLWNVADVRLAVDQRRVRMIWLPIMLVLTASLLAVALPDRTQGVLLFGFVAWQFSHFDRQNIGLVNLISRKWGARPLGILERRLLGISTGCAILRLITRSSLLGLSNVTVSGVEWEVVARVTTVVFASILVLATAVTLRSGRPTPVSASYIVAVAFTGPVFLFSSPQAAVTGIVVAHGLQYLLLVRWRKQRTKSAIPSNRFRSALTLFGIVVLGGSVLAAMAELGSATDRSLHTLYGAYLGLVMAHFAVDSVIWHAPSANGSRVLEGRYA
jgi:hypothetical protein